MESRSPLPPPSVGSRAARVLALMVVLATIGPGCASSKDVKVAAVTQSSGFFGALMVSSDGRMLLPIVSRDPGGNATGVTGAVFVDSSGTSMTVFLDPVTGLPARAVLGDFVLLFSNWDTGAKTVDIARIYGPTNYIEIYRGVEVDPRGLGPSASTPGRLTSAMTCFPACESDQKNLAELLKVAGLGLSVGGCGVAVAISWGAAALPCTGLIVSTASLVVSDETWLDNLGEVGNILGSVDVFQCALGDAGSCVSTALDLGGKALDEDTQTVTAAQPFLDTAQAALDNAGAPAGIVQGEAPKCANDYECTPGAYLPCYPTGTRQCNMDCRWNACPPDEVVTGGHTSCQGGLAECNCGSVEACVTVKGASCVQAYYKSSAGTFICASCSDCNGAATAVARACCPTPP